MKLSLKFNSGLRRTLAPDDRRFWFLWSAGLRIKIQANPIWEIEIYWKRLLIGGAALAVAGYLALVTGAYWWWQRNPLNQVRWTDIALAPVAWENLKVRRGDTAIATALDRLKKQDYVEAFYGLRVGLSRAPANVKGRVTLARLFAGSDPAGALKTLEDGLAHTPGDPELLRALFAFYALQQSRTYALGQADRLLARGDIPDEARTMLAGFRSGLLAELGRYDEAAAALAGLPAPAPGSPDARRLHQLHFSQLLKTGALDEAAAYLAGHFTDGSPESLRAAGDLALARGDAEAFQSAVRRLKVAVPDQIAPYLYAYQGWVTLKRPSLRDAEERDYYLSFGSQDAALQAFAALLVNLDQPDAIRRAADVARSNRLSAFAFRVHLTEIALRRGDTDAALRELRGWENAVDTLTPAQRFYPEFIKRLARASLAPVDQPVTPLQEHLLSGRGQAQPAIYTLAVETLERVGNFAAARQIADTGLRTYPHADPLQAARGRVDAALARLAPAAGAAAAENTAAAPLLALPATGPETLALLDAALAGDELRRARDILQAVRSQRPGWLGGAEADLATREAELALVSQDGLTARAALRGLLDRHRTPEDLKRFLVVARRLAERDRLAEARLVHDELAASPSANADVRRALAELNLPDDTGAVLASAEAAFAALDRWLAAAAWNDAERLYAQIKERPPVWATEARTGLATREVTLRLALGQRPQALAALREIVIRAGAPRAAAFKLVRDTAAAGEQDHAVFLAREIVRLLPDDAAAARLLKEAQAPRVEPAP